MIPSTAASDHGLGRLASVSMPAWRSLAPGRERARSLLDVAQSVLHSASASDGPAVDALCEGLVEIARAMDDAFPRNIFGDLDFLAASVWAGAARRRPDAAGFIHEQCHRIAGLQRLFGEGTAIRFRYVHDFVYGFDWAKWVAREPSTRAEVGPFDPPFLASMEQRGHELLELIADGRDRKYPPLPDGRPRNPFGFSREAEAEVTLHRHLAKEGLVPVPAWRIDAQPEWDRPFAELRRQRALALGLGL